MKDIYKNLPSICFHQSPSNPKELIVIKKGEMGYFVCDYVGDYMFHNERIGVSFEEAEAMKWGSMHGWDTKGINPSLFKEMAKKFREENKIIHLGD